MCASCCCAAIKSIWNNHLKNDESEKIGVFMLSTLGTRTDITIQHLLENQAAYKNQLYGAILLQLASTNGTIAKQPGSPIPISAKLFLVVPATIQQEMGEATFKVCDDVHVLLHVAVLILYSFAGTA